MPDLTALVTGATSGIGRAITTELSTAGYTVVAVGRNVAHLSELAAMNGVTAVQADVRDIDAIQDALKGKDVDIVVSNAGILTTSGAFAGTDPDQIDAMIDINLKAPLRLAHRLLPGMIARRRGHLLFVGSIAGHAPFGGSAIYGASKAGLASFCEALRCDLLGTNVRVTELVPGRVETSLYRDTHGSRARDVLYDGYRAVQPQDVARLVRTVIELPVHVDVSRLDILPTDQAVGGGQIVRSPSI